MSIRSEKHFIHDQCWLRLIIQEKFCVSVLNHGLQMYPLIQFIMNGRFVFRDIVAPEIFKGIPWIGKILAAMRLPDRIVRGIHAVGGSDIERLKPTVILCYPERNTDKSSGKIRRVR